MMAGSHDAGHHTFLAFTPAEAIAAGRKLIEEAERITMTELAGERAARHIAVNQVLPMLRAWHAESARRVAA